MQLTPPPIYSLKNRCRFKTATSSFIYPANYVQNVKALGPYFDEIELLFLESRQAQDLPDARLITDLKALQQEFGLSYNIHLPTDVKPNAVDKNTARRDTDTICKFMAAVLPLNPASFCLHLPYDDGPDFSARCRKTLSALLAEGVPPRKITVENLDYPLTMLQPLLEELDFSVCLDIGHAFAFNTGFMEHVRAFADRIHTVHLHSPGPNGDDHRDLACLGDNWPVVWNFLRTFNGTVCLEVFSIEILNKSLAFLKPCLEETP